MAVPNTCPKCGAAAEAGAVFCTGCGIRLPEAASNQSSTAGEGRAPNAEGEKCPVCQEVIEPGAAFCTGCGAGIGKADDTTVAPGGTAISTPAATLQQPSESVQSGVAGSSSVAASTAAVQPAYAVSAGPKSQPELGGSSSGHKLGPTVIVVLLLVILGAAALLWLRPSSAPSSSGSKVLILTPQPSSLTVEPNSTTSLSVAVQGDNGAGVTWKIAENYGGSVAPAGVTLQGSRVIYKATYHSGGTPGDYHVVATSATNKDVRVSIAVRVER
jgi:Double zinc ribbon